MNDTPTAAPMRENVIDAIVRELNVREMLSASPTVLDRLQAERIHRVVLAYTTRPDAGNAIENAADILDQYARYIATVKADDLERHPYLPSVEQAVQDLRAALSRPDAGDEDVERRGIFLPLDDRAKAAIQNAATFLDSAAGEGIEIDGLDAMNVVDTLHELLDEDPSRGFHEDVALWLKGRIQPTVPEEPTALAAAAHPNAGYVLDLADPQPARGFSRFDPPGLWESEHRLSADDAGEAGR